MGVNYPEKTLRNTWVAPIICLVIKLSGDRVILINISIENIIFDYLYRNVTHCETN